MATLDEVFAAMPDPAAATYEPLTIDPETRKINVPETENIFGVESDGRTSTKHFTVPRMVGNGLDLAACFLRVNYRNAGGEKDAYLIQDATVEGQNLVFSWELSEKVTRYKGNVQFIVCAIMPGSGNSYPEWNTTIATGTVLEGLEPDLDTVEDETADMVAQLLSMVSSQTSNVEAAGAAQVTAVQTAGANAEAAAVAAIQAQGAATIATIPPDYTALAAYVDTLARTRAAAIVCRAEGSTIKVEDASADPLHGLRIFGKSPQVKTTGVQLANLPDAGPTTVNGIVWTCKNGVVNAVGTTGAVPDSASSSAGILYNLPIIAGNYYISGDNGNIRVYVCIHHADTSKTYHRESSFTLDGTETLAQVYCQVSSGTFNGTVYPMVNAGDTANPWERYSGGMVSPSPAWPQELETIPAPVVTVYGRNKSKNAINGNSAAQYAHALIIDADLEPNTVYTLSFIGAPGQRVYANENLFAYKFLTCDGSRQSMTVQTVGAIYKSNANQYAGDGWAVLKNAEGNTIISDFSMVQIEDGETMTEYEPYTTQSITMADELPGIPVESGGNYTDENGQAWVCDEVDLARGVYVQRIMVSGVEDWAISEYNVSESPNGIKWQINKQFTDSALNGTMSHAKKSVMANRFPIVDYTVENNVETGTCLGMYGHATAVEFRFRLLKTEYPTKAAAVEAMAGTVVMYPLSEPIETPLSEAEIQAFRALHSNKPTTILMSTAGAHMILDYAADPKTYIDNKLSALVAANA